MGQIVVSQIAVDDVVAAIQTSSKIDTLYETAIAGGPQKWAALRSIHRMLDTNGFSDPYPVDWTRIFTPIERNAWNGFRCNGLAPRPQYPVGPFFVDFAFPEQKLAFECDGKAFHNELKDKARDKTCSEYGWRVFRATGSECSRFRLAPWEKHETLEDQRDDKASGLDWLNNTSDGLIYAIAKVFFRPGANVEPFTREDLQSRLWRASINSMVC